MVSEISSRLWKSDALVRSSVFPQLVRAAASMVGQPFSTDLLEHVAADAALLDVIVLPRGEGMDAALSQMASDPDTSAALDAAIVQAVTDYTEETD